MSHPIVQHTNEPEQFHDRAAFDLGIRAAAGSAAFGTFVSAAQNSIQTHNHGAMGVFTRSGGTIALFTAIGGIFAYTDAAVANFRQKEDFVNGAAGGCAAGMAFGAHRRSVPMMFGSCLALGALVGTFDAAGKTFTSTAPHATPASIASEGHGDEGHGAGEAGWREQREARRASFFKKKKDTEVDHE